MIITSLLDNDLYTFSVADFVFANAPKAIVKYRFICRNKEVKLGYLSDRVIEQVKFVSGLKFSPDEIRYLRGLRYLHKEFIDSLENFSLSSSDVTVTNVDGNLSIDIEGLWINTIMWEVPLLAIVNELYFSDLTDNFSYDKKNWQEIGVNNLETNCDLLKDYPLLTISEFGTRRRFSKDWQETVFDYMRKRNLLIGTSNVYLAKKYNFLVTGTMSHQLFSAYLSLAPDIRSAQRYVLYLWLMHFDTNEGPDLGIALSDTFTTKAFFEDFKFSVANAYRGVRQDSGDPIMFGENVIAHYRKLGIDPLTKTIIFSDGLDISTAINIYKHFQGRIKTSFGIGTFLTNNCGLKPINIVIKLIQCNGQECVKLSDTPTKAIGDSKMVERVIAAYCR
jgi:nicotinate phosphoribosyltransferase